MVSFLVEWELMEMEFPVKIGKEERLFVKEIYSH